MYVIFETLFRSHSTLSGLAHSQQYHNQISERQKTIVDTIYEKINHNQYPKHIKTMTEQPGQPLNLNQT